MIARLWWKELRQFWPIWLTVAGAAAVGQWMMLRYFGNEVRNGALAPYALGWACLYGFAVGAAAFAGEREAKTLVLLDTLPVSRRVLWSGKASFALASTVALAAVLFGFSMISTDRYDDLYSPPMVLLGGGMLIVEAVGWGLFWSSLSKTALAAAALAVISMTVTLPLAAWSVMPGTVWGPPLGLRAAIVALIAGASALIIAAPRRGFGSSRESRREVLSPVVVHTRPGRLAAGPVSAWESWTTAIWRLTWETIRGGGPTWGLHLFLGLILPFFFMVAFNPYGVELAGLANIVIAVSAGVSIFGSENRGRTTRFLAHHGVRPGAVWVTKLAVWGFGLAVIWAPYVVLFGVDVLSREMSRRNDNSPILFAATALNCVAIGQLCGMAIRRGITAWLITVIATIAVMAPQVALYTAGMVSVEWLLATPLALLAVSWGWCGDWLIERPGIGRWLRLVLLLIGAFGLVGSSYASYRVMSVPDFGTTLDRQFLQLDSATVPDSSNAAGLYREAGRTYKDSPRNSEFGEPTVARVIGEGWDPKAESVVKWLETNRETLALVRRAAAMPACQFARPDSLTLFSPLELPPLLRFGQLLALDAREKQSRGDLAGAWEDVVAMFRMARQISRQATIVQSLNAISIESQALELAMSWSADPRQTPERIKAALAEYEALPAPIPADETIRVEAVLIDRTLALPPAELPQRLFFMYSKQSVPAEMFWTRVWRDAETTPWELARTRRAARLLLASAVAQARQEPWQRSSYRAGMIELPNLDVSDGNGVHRVWSAALDSYLRSTPLLKELFPATESYLAAADRAELGRRALVQVLAIRIWQLTHGGQVSEDLGTMVKNASTTFPRDPYTNAPFLWVRSEGQSLLPLGESLRWQPGNLDNKTLRPTPGSWLLYSVGPEKHDDNARANYGQGGVHGGDIIFPIPPGGIKPEAAKPDGDGPPDVKP